MRLLGIDYGEKRIGIAVSDELGITARGLMTMTRRGLKHDMEEIGRVAESHGVEGIVVGYPVRLDGTRGIQCEKVDRFIKVLEAKVPLPIVRWDESLSTREAEDILTEALVRGKKRKAIVDKLAASIILQSYLNYREKKKYA